MATRKRSTSKARAGTAGKRKTASRIGTQAPKRKKQTSGRHHRVSAEHASPSRKKSHGRRTVNSSSRKRAASAGAEETMLSGRRRREEPAVIDADSDREIFGVQMSERRRRGESRPAMPEANTKTTQTSEPRSVPKTGIAKSRKRS
jgi:hypothetical protein